MFLDPRDFPFVRELEGSWRIVHDELQKLRTDHFLPWPERFLYGEGWDVFALYAFGKRVERNCALCPETTRIVAGISGLTTAGFSSLVGGAHIKPHVGYTNEVLRCHLGIIVPPDCAIRVGSETRSWEPGRCLVFDDTIEHEAWNRGEQTRVVLLLDFLRDAQAHTSPSTVAHPAGIEPFLRSLDS